MAFCSWKTQKHVTLFVTLFLFFSPHFLKGQTLYINEFLASNSTILADEFGDFDDWVEIYNPGTTAVDIGGMYVTDDLLEPTQWQIPTTDATLTTIAPGGFLLLWFDKETDQGELHVDAKLSASGEDIGLIASDGITVIDSYTFGAQLTDISEGRFPDGTNNWVFFGAPTPESSNDTPPGIEKTAIPIPSITGGLYPAGTLTVSLTSETPDATIYYTLDASNPTVTSIEYTGPISIDEITSLRAIAYSPTLLPSLIATHTYLIDVAHDFAIIALNTDPDNLFDEEIGIFTNFDEEIEHPAHVQFFETDGTLAFAQDIEIEIQGTASASLPQKSLKLKAKESLGNEFFNYPIFPDLPYDSYRSFLIRQSGQDWNKTMFRDAMEVGLARNLSDLNGLIDPPDLDQQGYRPGVVYLNGEYWGIYNFREQMNWKYLSTHYGLDKEELDVVEDLDELEDGDLSSWNAFLDFLENNDFSDPGNYNALENLADIPNFLDNRLFGIILDNNDWPGNNNKKWRERSPDGKWRWISKDLDFGFGLRPLNAPWNSGDFTTDMLSVCLAENSSNYYNPDWSTVMLRRLMENDVSKNYFINRAADQLNVLFTQSRMIERINNLENIYTPEIQQHFDRWQSGFNGHAANVEVLRIFANGRTNEVRNHFVNYFNEIDGTSDITLTGNPVNAGDIKFSTINLNETTYPWTGTYFNGIDIPVIAIPQRGYVFDSWSDSSLGTSKDAIVNLSNDLDLTANFLLGSTAIDPIVINEINYNSPDFPDPSDWIELYNPNPTSVDISGWYFEDESGRFFGLPTGTIIEPGAYLVLAEDLANFNLAYGSVTDVIGDFGADPGGFGLSGGGELITLKNATGVLIDGVEYDDQAPWPTEADGDGPTLQLLDPALDNALGESWFAFVATPAALNGVLPSIQDQAIDFSTIDDKFTFDPAFDLSAIATSGLPVSFSLISGPATLDGNTLTLDGVVGTVVVRASQGGNAQFHPASDVDQSFFVSEFTGGGPTGYCETEGNAPWSEWISNVNFISIDHDSGKDLYGDFTTQATYASTGETYPIVLTPGFSFTQYNEFWNVWIDYNQDGDFEDADELAFSTNSTSTNVTGNISIPSTATLGITRMRIAMKRDAAAGPCEIFEKGEVEDYTVIIQGGSPVLTISCPTDITISAAPGANNASVIWNLPSGTTSCPDEIVTVTQTQGPASGSDFLIGTTTIVYEISDECSNVETCSFQVTVTNTPATLSLTCSENFTVVADPGATTAVVNWVIPTAISDCSLGQVVLTQTAGPNNGTTLPVGSSTTISYEATDPCGNVETCSFVITVESFVSILSISCPLDIEVNTSPGGTSAPATWSTPIATTTCPVGMPTVTQTQGASSGSNFPIGVSTISYNAIDDCGNDENCSFTITVESTSATLSLICPDDFAIIADPEATTAVVNWVTPTAISDCSLGQVVLTQTAGPNNGTTLPVGSSTTISYEATDPCGNIETCSFVITVESFVSTLNISCPLDIEVNTAPGGTSAPATWTTPIATTTCPVGTPTVTQTQGVSSGSNFPIGVSTISYNAVDDCGNNENCSFTVTVNSIPSTLTLVCPENQTITIPTGTTSTSVNWTVPTINSDCSLGMPTLVQTSGPANGGDFSVGSTTISYEATDPCGNIETCSFTIFVQTANSTISLSCPTDFILNIPSGATSVTANWNLPTAFTTCNGGSGSTNCDVLNLPGFSILGVYEGNKYFVSNDVESWTVARDICESFDGHLAVITDEAENQFLEDNLSVIAHIGISDESVEGVFEWTDATPVGYTNLTEDNSDSKDYVTFQPWNGKWRPQTDLVYKNFALELECGGSGGLMLEQTSGPENGDELEAGIYTVSYEASDACGDVQTCSFTITVENGPPILSLTCPDNILIEVPSGTTSASVSWNTPIVSTDCVPMDITLEQTAGLANGSDFPLGQTTIVYEASDLCRNFEICEFTIMIEVESTSASYCESEGNAPWEEYISNVTIGDINNDSGKDQYGDFTDLSTDLELGSATDIFLTPKFSWSQSNVYFRVWIDLNQDNDFTDPGEVVFENFRPAGAPGSTVTPLSDIVNISESATVGSTRMRVSMKVDSYPDPCETFDLGEVEDYTINIISPTLLVTELQPILEFTASRNGRVINLDWVTNTEVQNDYFQIERSADGINFEPLMEIESKYNLNQAIYYQKKDLNPIKGFNYYRLKQISAGGEYQYADIQKVKFDLELVDFSVFPNPATDDVFINLRPYIGQNCDIQIHDLLGHQMLHQQVSDIPIDPIKLDLAAFQNGLYMLTVQVGSLKRRSTKIVVGKKY